MGSRVALPLLLLVVVCGVARADERVLGTWLGAGPDNQGAKVTIERDALAVNGERIPLRFPSPGALSIGPPEAQESMRYEVQGDQLTLIQGEFRQVWRRAGATPAPSGGGTPNPLGGGTPNPLGGPTNPLGGQPAAAPDPFARRFEGDGLELRLEGARAEGYGGQATMGGASYPVRAREVAPSLLQGSFKAGENEFEFEAKLEGDQLNFVTGGKQYRLQGEPLAAPANPLAGGGPQNPLSGGLGGSGGGLGSQGGLGSGGGGGAPAGKPWLDRESNVAAYLPEGWLVTQTSAEGCVVNPGFAQGQTLDAVLSMHCLPLEPAQQGLAVDKLLTLEIPEFRQSLAETGVQTRDPERPVQRAQLGGQDVAFVTMKGQTAQGRPALVWGALKLEGSTVLACTAIFLNGNEGQFLPQMEAVFTTMRPASAVGPEFQPSPDSPDQGGGR